MKSAVVAGIGTLGTGSAVTASYMLGAFDGLLSDADKQPGEKINLPTSLDVLNSNINKYGCIKEIFPGLPEAVGSVGNIESSPGIKSDFFKSDKKDEIKGCLIVNWNKKTFTGSAETKGTGDFSILGAAGQKDHKGFIVFAKAKPVDNEKKLSWEGVAYSTKKKENQQSGEIDGKREEKSGNKKLDKNGLSDKFPKADSTIHNDGFGGGFTDSDFEKMCTSTDACTSSVANPLRGYWEGQGASSEGGKKLGEGTPNLTAGWKELFGDSEGKMEEVVQNMTGTGTKKYPQESK